MHNSSSARLALAALVLTAAAAPSHAAPASWTVLYAAAGPELTAHLADAGAATLDKRGSVTLPENVQEAWPHPSRRYLYVGWSNNATGQQGHHGITAFRVDPGTGALQPHGRPVPLRARPVFLTADPAGQHVIAAYNLPSGASVHRIEADGSLGAERPQPAGLDFGVYAHQVRVDPSGRMVVIATRGNVPAEGKPEDPGAVKVFGYRDGVLANRVSIAPNGGRAFQPRHVDFHPTRPFVFATIEAQNKLHVYRVVEGPSLGPAPLFSRDTLANPSSAGQATSAIHVHPNGKFVYLGNRGPADGENSIAVYSINQDTGEPNLIQSAGTNGVHPRTFTLDAAGTMLVVANMQRSGNEPASLAVFRIGSDGKLSFARKYAPDPGGKRSLFWTGMLESPR